MILVQRGSTINTHTQFRSDVVYICITEEFIRICVHAFPIVSPDVINMIKHIFSCYLNLPLLALFM